MNEKLLAIGFTKDECHRSGWRDTYRSYFEEGGWVHDRAKILLNTQKEDLPRTLVSLASEHSYPGLTSMSAKKTLAYICQWRLENEC